MKRNFLCSIGNTLLMYILSCAIQAWCVFQIDFVFDNILISINGVLVQEIYIFYP